MCGIAGYLTASHALDAGCTNVIRRMTDAIRHRGPDGNGAWLDSEAGVALGQRRLAIIDLSPAGAQPMISGCGRYVLVFNGEIYNFGELRDRLEAESREIRWRGHSDTEVLLAAIQSWGLVAALQAANGMFALAIWDRSERSLSLAVDRFGEKPLYYGWMGKSFLFGSEIKALRAHPDWRGELDRESLSNYTYFGYVPAPLAIFKGLSKVKPGGLVTLSYSGASIAREPQVSSYWNPAETIARVHNTRKGISEADALDEFENVLSRAIQLRMISDVPLGAFLSGGFDSTSIVALMQRMSDRPVRTFTIGFTEQGHDEAPFAKAISRLLGTDHSELYVRPQDAIDVIPSLPTLYDEPFADSSQIPTYLVSKMAREHVTVALSGDAGDELFGGYRRYFAANRMLSMMIRVPHGMRKLAASGVHAIGPRRLSALYRVSMNGRYGHSFGRLAMKFADMLAAETAIEGYHRLTASWQYPTEVVRGGIDIDGARDAMRDLPSGLGVVEQMMYADLMHYLPYDILTKVDRAAMAVSLEARVPYLDPNVFEFAWSLPLDFKVRGGTGKWLIRELVYRHVPREMMDRPKTGFGIPLGSWLRKELRPWVEDLLDEARLRQDGYFEPAPVCELWQQHLAGAWERQQHLWPILVFQQWLREQESTPVKRAASRETSIVVAEAS